MNYEIEYFCLAEQIRLLLDLLKSEYAIVRQDGNPLSYGDVLHVGEILSRIETNLDQTGAA